MTLRDNTRTNGMGTRCKVVRLTAMFGLSARTSSCGGEGGLVGLGGDAVVAGELGTFLGPFPFALRKMGANFFSSSSVGGADDSEDVSESLMVWL